MRQLKALVSVSLLTLALISNLTAAPTQFVDEPVITHKKLDDGTILLDFGKVAFGNLKVKVPENKGGSYSFHFGEAFMDGRVDRKPPGTVRYNVAKVHWVGGEETVVAPKAVERHLSHPSAVKLDLDSVITPFCWVEIEGWKGEFEPSWIVRQSRYLTAWDESAADFECSDETLNRIWDLCKYSMKATTFAGVYVDGDRERIPYEADAYLNQLTHYYADSDKQIARDTYDYLIEKPTWPSEWAPHMVFMAHADWMFTGDSEWIKPRYEKLKTKLLMHRVGDDGWVRSDKKAQSKVKGFRGERDIVDWPRGERDGYVFTEINTVVNAFHLKAISQMADLAEAIGNKTDAANYRERYNKGVKQFNEALWMEEKGAYRDGVGTDHTSAHATFFPLAFGLTQKENHEAATNFLKAKGMACSVYAAQYLMEALFQSGSAKYAIQLMLADGDRSWKHMVNSGTTITWEAWDQKYKPNQDWNHAWGAAPGNLLPRYVLGVEPIEAGWKRTKIEPHPSGLTYAKGKVPTAMGPLSADWRIEDGVMHFKCDIPEGMTAVFRLPGKEDADSKELSAGSHAFSIKL